MWNGDIQVHTSYAYFTQLLKNIFEYPAGGFDVSVKLFQLKQDADSAAN